ncbi:carboxylesterase family protein [Pedobacter metabolipauper]|uniref:Putative esterase n=1 Tax=Pedobacter metabolipauper TaxID=425513 RepID=A0A4R6SS10_9SPHI|nr:alpha/beta hydrolase-fold protein [Pedobacter metabolipauper]TDQ08067.1 putative esterase [Pedobacter metabolipauper]
MKSIIPLLFLSLFTSLIIGCANLEKGSTYFKTETKLTRDSINSYRKQINDISNDVFKPFQFTGANHTAINYRLLAPVDVSTNSSYPLVLVLHGSHAVGTDNVTQLGILAKLWAKDNIREKYPAYIVVPQFPVRSSNYIADAGHKVLSSSPDECLNTALELIDSLKKVLPVNGRKIYVIGHSMGASSTINSIGLRPDLFAAAVSVSGIPDFNHIDALSKTPTWFIHGNKDPENPIGSDSLLFEKLRSKKVVQIRYWEIDKLEHEIFPGLYIGEALPEWLFKQVRK